jgi:hypothetical protein
VSTENRVLETYPYTFFSRYDGALILPDVSVGMIEASATRRPTMPWTRS